MATSDPAAPPEPTTAPQARPRRSYEPDGYWLSSLELRRGVDVEVLGVRHVPGEALREFMRMHLAWEAAPAPGGAAAPARARRAPELDIAFEADGSVTVPGDLRSTGA